jgi:type VI secretion system protein ImpJ
LIGRLFFGHEDRSGYECVQIARLVRGARPKVEPILDSAYIAPVLSCQASPPLMALLSSAVITLRTRARELAATVPNMKNLSFAEKGADISGLVMLQSMNAALSVLEVVVKAPEVSPFEAYRALATSIGHLAIFGDDRIAPELPAYDHSDLSECFSTGLKWLGEFAEAQPTAPYDVLPFLDDPQRPGISSIDMDPGWVQGAVSFFLGVEVAAEAQEAQSLVATGVKLVSPGDMEKVIRNVLNGIELEYVRRAPIAFPSRSGMHYFKIGTEGASRDQWLSILDQGKAVVLSTLSAVGKAAKFQMYVELPS